MCVRVSLEVSLWARVRPWDQGRAGDDLQENSKLTYPDFEALSIQFPNLFFPAFRMQGSMRKAFFGVKWWERKLRKYAKVKSEIQTTKLNTDKLDALAAARQARADRKRERFERRKAQARQARASPAHALRPTPNAPRMPQPEATRRLPEPPRPLPGASQKPHRGNRRRLPPPHPTMIV